MPQGDDRVSQADRSVPNEISGDVPLTPAQRFQWYVSNIALYNAEEAALDRVWNFRCDLAPYPGPFCKARQTPSRVLSNLFWLNLPATAIREELGPIKLLDVGCGSGRYSPSSTASLVAFRPTPASTSSVIRSSISSNAIRARGSFFLPPNRSTSAS